MFMSEEHKDSMTAIWQISCWNCYQSSYPSCHVFVSSIINILSVINSWVSIFLLNSGRPKTQVFYKQKADGGHEEESVLESPIGFCLFTLFRIDILYCCSAAMLYCDCCLRGHIPNFWPRNEWEQFLIISN